ncbi:hypothetical protein A2863_02560 [Candidatus Woesebacteria bacterium RIFCSPHIGHO2_01_FULL_38_9b]|uniref:Glycosyltransferase RgtA/B/C/D-like domain-containing protein n=1 Tax=Candidatus Woesebacteria bacterium RIFCSPHIGHO2_01_FULL_38_9b TaxID=1802493 RepID=A0A1F7Y3S3_9BACT|nr:MAG: hypothetical protein A2863_02560 [Candidatus Woesebacteria bacterium RIFCSPHIGHO2_01_FULL_38_9b]
MKFIFNKWVIVYIILATFLFSARVFIFSTQFGFELDSGWYLGVAKNFALRQKYASYTNTTISEVPGSNPSIHNRFSVQDKNGFSHFPAGVTVGPGYVFPQALLIKLLGNGWWQYKLWPLFTLAFLFAILFYLAWFLGGIVSLFIVQVWLWFYPQIYLAYGFEALSESIALLYLLLGFFFYFRFLVTKHKKWPLFVSGSFGGFSLLTKNIFVINVVAFAPILLFRVVKKKKYLKSGFKEIATFTTGFILPIFLFELYRFIYLFSNFGMAGYQAINKDIKLTMLSGGSGFGMHNSGTFNEFFLKKLLIFSDLGLGNTALLAWILWLLVPIIFFTTLHKYKKELAFLIYTSSTTSFFWFSFMSPTGWARHIWQGIVMGIIILSVSIGLIIKQKGYKLLKILLLLPFTIVFLKSLFSPLANPKFILGKEDLLRWQAIPSYRGLQGFPSSVFFPLKDQKEALEFFENKISDKDRIYYDWWYLVAELATITDKVFFPVDRYFLGQDDINPETKSYLIFGPYQMGEYSLTSPTYLSQKTAKYCKVMVFRNNSYAACELKERKLISSSD